MNALAVRQCPDSGGRALAAICGPGKDRHIDRVQPYWGGFGAGQLAHRASVARHAKGPELQELRAFRVS